jgi:hypothetical protein
MKNNLCTWSALYLHWKLFYYKKFENCSRAIVISVITHLINFYSEVPKVHLNAMRLQLPLLPLETIAFLKCFQWPAL